MASEAERIRSLGSLLEKFAPADFGSAPVSYPILRAAARDCRSAAAEIGRLTAEVTRLRAERDALVAYAECQEAFDGYDDPRGGICKSDLLAVLSRYGFEGKPDTVPSEVMQFIRSLQANVLAKTSGEEGGEDE